MQQEDGGFGAQVASLVIGIVFSLYSLIYYKVQENGPYLYQLAEDAFKWLSGLAGMTDTILNLFA